MTLIGCEKSKGIHLNILNMICFCFLFLNAFIVHRDPSLTHGTPFPWTPYRMRIYSYYTQLPDTASGRAAWKCEIHARRALSDAPVCANECELRDVGDTSCAFIYLPVSVGGLFAQCVHIPIPIRNTKKTISSKDFALCLRARVELYSCRNVFVFQNCPHGFRKAV